MSADPPAPPPASDPVTRTALRWQTYFVPRRALRWETYFNVDPRRADSAPEVDPVLGRLEDVQQQLEAMEPGKGVLPEQLAAIRETVAAALQASAELGEYHAYENRAWAILGIMAGAVLGQLGGLSLTEMPPRVAHVLLLVFLCGTGFCALAVRRIRAHRPR